MLWLNGCFLLGHPNGEVMTPIEWTVIFCVAVAVFMAVMGLGLTVEKFWHKHAEAVKDFNDSLQTFQDYLEG